MKFRLFLSLIPSAAIAFQQVGVDTSLHPYRATTTALQIVPERFERAQHCATHYGSCDVEEMEELADELEHFQDHLGGADALDVKVTETSIPSTIENDNFSIPIKIFTPKKIRAVVFFIHGGIFALGDMHSHPTISVALCKLGLIVVTASFRNGKEAPHETNVTTRDLIDVIHYCTTIYSELPFGLVGSSSGGFFAIQLSQSLLSSSSSNNTNNNDRVVRPPSFCIPICPVADPFKRASYLRASISGSQQQLDGYNAVHTPEKSKFILEKQLSFWKSDDEMMMAAESIKSGGGSSTKSSITTSTNHRVPTLLIIGSADKNVPFDVTNEVQSWATRTIVIGGYGHELCDEIVNGGGYYCYLPDIERFLDYCLGGEGEEEIK